MQISPLLICALISKYQSLRYNLGLGMGAQKKNVKCDVKQMALNCREFWQFVERWANTSEGHNCV